MVSNCGRSTRLRSGNGLPSSRKTDCRLVGYDRPATSSTRSSTWRWTARWSPGTLLRELETLINRSPKGTRNGPWPFDLALETHDPVPQVTRWEEPELATDLAPLQQAKGLQIEQVLACRFVHDTMAVLMSLECIDSVRPF